MALASVHQLATRTCVGCGGGITTRSSSYYRQSRCTECGRAAAAAYAGRRRRQHEQQLAAARAGLGGGLDAVLESIFVTGGFSAVMFETDAARKRLAQRHRTACDEQGWIV